MKLAAAWPWLLLCAFLLVLASCGDEESAESGIPPTFSAIQTQVFDVSCNFDACHSTRGRNGGLVLQGEGAYEALVGVTPVDGAASTEGLKRVVAGDPDQSFLLIKLDPTLDARYGALMPLNSDGLPADQVAAIRQWIADGAPR
jgi:hypothetical protein